MIVGFVEKIHNLQGPNFQGKTKNAIILLANELGFIIHASHNFVEQYLKNNNANDVDFDENKVSIDELFIGINECSEEDLRNGFKTQMITNLNQTYVANNIEVKKFKSAVVCINTY